MRPPHDRIDRTVEPVPRIPRPRWNASHDLGAPVEEALRALDLPTRDIASAMKAPSRNQQKSRYCGNVGDATYAPDAA